MAVPKKRTSKSKSKKANWKNKANFVSKRSLSLAKSLLSTNASSFYYINRDSLISEI